MTRKERAKLRTSVRQIIEEKQAAGIRFPSSAVYDFLEEEVPWVLEEAMVALARSAVRDMSQKIMSSRVRKGAVAQTIDMFEHHNMRLPRSITLPQENGDLLWTPLERVTPNEWQAHIDRVMAGAVADIASATEQQAALDMMKENLEPEHLDVMISQLRPVLNDKKRSA